MKKLLIILTFLAFNLTVFSQIDASKVNSIPLDKEITVVSTNTNFILAGEYLYYSFYVFEKNKPSTTSKIGYVEFVGVNNNVILSHKLKLNNGVANGDFFIPSKVRTGEYKIIGYTNWTKNNDKNNSFVKSIYVVNPFTSNNQEIKNATSTVEINKLSTQVNQSNSSDGISLVIPKAKYNSRQLVDISISIENALKKGNYNLSIRKLDSIEIKNTNTKNYISGNDDTNTFFIPELRGELICGKISSSTNDIKNKSVSLSIPGGNYVFKMSKTNVNGEFFFNLNDNYTNKEAVFQVVEENKEDYKIELIANNYNNYDELNFNALKIDSNLKNNIELRNIQSQVDNAYYEKKQDSTVNINLSKPFYSSLGIEYILDDYTRFKTVRETFIEVIKEAGVRKNGDAYRFFVFDFEEEVTKLSDLKPLVLVDGEIVINNDDLIYYNSNKIKKINVVKGQYLYGAKLFDGIIDITTFLKDFKTSQKGDFMLKTELNKPISSKIYYQPDYSKEKNKRIPDYRRQLLWLPNINFNTNQMQFKAYTSDNKGAYEIRLEGYSLNGEFVSATNYFTVK